MSGREYRHLPNHPLTLMADEAITKLTEDMRWMKGDRAIVLVIRTQPNGMRVAGAASIGYKNAQQAVGDMELFTSEFEGRN